MSHEDEKRIFNNLSSLIYECEKNGILDKIVNRLIYYSVQICHDGLENPIEYINEWVGIFSKEYIKKREKEEEMVKKIPEHKWDEKISESLRLVWEDYRDKGNLDQLVVHMLAVCLRICHSTTDDYRDFIHTNVDLLADAWDEDCKKGEK